MIITNLTGSSYLLTETERDVESGSGSKSNTQVMATLQLEPYGTLVVSDISWEADERIRAGINYLLYIGKINVTNLPVGWILSPEGTLVSVLGPSTGSGFIYVHNQPTASTIWTINHSLGIYPNVTTVDTLDRVMEGDVEYLSTTVVKVTFSVVVSGRAFLS